MPSAAAYRVFNQCEVSDLGPVWVASCASEGESRVVGEAGVAGRGRAGWLEGWFCAVRELRHVGAAVVAWWLSVGG